MKPEAIKTLGAAVVIAMLAGGCASRAGATLAPSPADEQAIRGIEEQFRVAKLKNDVATLERIVAADYYGLNQYGAARDKAQLVDLFRVYKLNSLEVDVRRVRISGNHAVVAGRQREVFGCSGDNCPPEISLFMRTYVRESDGWRILTNAHYKDPNNGRPSDSRYAKDAW